MCTLSIVIPVRNGAAHLREAVDSARAQTLADLEIVLVDDGSTDETPALCDALATEDSRIRVLHVPHGGAARATNVGVRASRGEWVARLDADDVIPPDRFARQIEWMLAHGLDVCGMQVERFGTRTGRLWVPETPEAARVELLFRPVILQPALMRREFALAHPYLEGVAFDDYELQTRLASRHRLGNMGEVGLYYRVHPAQSQSVARVEVLRDRRRFRFRYFYERFPGTPLESYLALSRVADSLPIVTEKDLACAGSWLVALSDQAVAEPRVRARMARRWRESWARSAALLPGTARPIYDDVAVRLVEG